MHLTVEDSRILISFVQGGEAERLIVFKKSWHFFWGTGIYNRGICKESCEEGEMFKWLEADA